MLRACGQSRIGRADRHGRFECDEKRRCSSDTQLYLLSDLITVLLVEDIHSM